MGSGSGKSSHSNGLLVALERFSAQSKYVTDLFERDEDFRGLCEDLADAEVALKGCRQLPADIREARRLEYEELVESLSSEIEQVLSRANVILLRPRG